MFIKNFKIVHIKPTLSYILFALFIKIPQKKLMKKYFTIGKNFFNVLQSNSIEVKILKKNIVQTQKIFHKKSYLFENNCYRTQTKAIPSRRK